MNTKYIVITIIAILIVTLIILAIYPYFKGSFKDTFTGSGYGMNHTFGKLNTLIPLNEVSKSTDFKLLSLMAQVRFSIVKPPNDLVITKTSKGIKTKTPSVNSNIILFPGQADYILKQEGREVWPRQFANMKNNEKATIYNNNTGHFNSITTLLENLNYIDGDKLNTITYDFRKFDFNELFKQFLTYLKSNTVIIGYDFGCVMANMCINSLEINSTQHQYIKKFILICPTIGGIPMTLRDYFSGNGIIKPSIIENYDSVLMSMPNKMFYDNPIAIYNSVSYNANNINELMKYNEKSNDTINLFNELIQKQELSFKNPEVDCVIVTSNQFSTPVAYNFHNDLSQNPERYLGKNNNQKPLNDIQNNGTFEGLQAKGDKVVPFSSILKLRELWKGKNDINIELIKDKDHFTILKSYELALIIMANI